MDSTFAGSIARLEVQNGTTTHSGTITATGGDNRLDVDGNQRMIINGVLAGGGTFRKEDSGLLLVNNALNTQSGLFTVNGGILGGSGTLASSTVTMNNGTTSARAMRRPLRGSHLHQHSSISTAPTAPSSTSEPPATW